MTAILVHPHLLFTPRTWSAFPAWYLWKKPLKIVLTTLKYMGAFAEIFSFLFLLRTMFAPWKSITEHYAVRGINLELFMQAFTLNATSRVIGAVIRLFAIALGLVVQIIIASIGIGLLIVWYAFPLLCAWLLIF